ncbi:enoyl-CoA hydratase family protein [Gordonia soli]|uniref:Putative enoyl-CoA hydratase n=1 Tax=Gordonia soli NBRC 108243 TaxID=1223545 RepID=M0QH83_9ACTN|nr:enoyl-CoA hydratase family protein [Gordonia soli]GAC67794.1 putative enoyl-CoA hydratase [Gordonia soli NBRC 108243]
MTEVVHVDAEAGVLTLTLDSPNNRNALGEALVAQLLAGLRRAESDPDVRAVVLTHAGGTFCAGADLGEALRRGASVEEASAAGTTAMLDLMRTILELPKPVIAKVDGHVRAGGFGLLGAADIAIGGPACTFALTEARLGLAPSVISLVLLPKLGSRAVGRYFITGETFGPLTAVESGLLSEAVGDSGAVDAAVEQALAGIRKASPQGLAASKALTTADVLADFTRYAKQRAGESAELFASDEAREGMSAFLAKRAPRWDITQNASS